MRKILSALAITVLLGACSNNFKKTVGLARSGPDEYQVQKQKPLYVPPHYELPEPKVNDLKAKKK